MDRRQISELRWLQADPESIDVTGGATVDQEGLANNYAVEPGKCIYGRARRWQRKKRNRVRLNAAQEAEE